MWETSRLLNKAFAYYRQRCHSKSRFMYAISHGGHDIAMNAQTPMSMQSDRTSSFDESERLAALRRLSLLDSPRSEAFDRVTRLAAISLGVPIVLVSLVDEARQWFKSCYGLDATETPREISFCTHAVASRAPLVVPDATRDSRFATNPLVTNAPKIRFYAGVPLFTRGGHAVGTLCAIDRRPRDLNYEATDILEDFASIVQDLVQAQEKVEEIDSLLAFATERERLLEEALESVPLGLIFASPSGRLRRANGLACEFLGTHPGAPQRKGLAEIIHPDDWSANRGFVDAVAAGHLEKCNLSVRLLKENGRYLSLHLTISLVRSFSGKPAYLFLILDTASKTQSDVIE